MTTEFKDYLRSIERYGLWSIRPGRGRQKGGGQCWYVSGPDLEYPKRVHSREEALAYLKQKGIA